MKEENTPLIETERLLLRKFTGQDLQDVFLILRDKEANVFLPWFPAETLDQAQKHLYDHYVAHYKRPCAYRYAICLKSDNRPIGYIGVGDGDSHDLGYGLRKEYWHLGITTEAAKAVSERLRQAGVSYITATHDVHNPFSGEVMKKIGMTYRYSYEELWRPKNIRVTFRMYQLNFDGEDRTYAKYWDTYPIHFVEEGIGEG